MSIQDTTSAPDIDFNTSAAKKLRKFRALKDKLARSSIAVGGISVIVAVMLIFFYLLYEVAPLFQSAEISKWQHREQVVEPYATPGTGETLFLAMEEQAEIGFRISAAGELTFFRTIDGEVISQQQAALPEGTSVTSFALASEASAIFSLGLSNGEVLVMKHEYKSTYPNGERLITPQITYPLGEAPIELSQGPVELLTLNGDEGYWALVGGNEQNLNVASISLEENLLTGEVEASSDKIAMPKLNLQAQKILLMPDRSWMFIAGANGKLAVVNMKGDSPRTTQVLDATDGEITVFKLLLGGNSLILGDSNGDISQWFLVRDNKNGWQLQQIRDFHLTDNPIADIALEQRRKGFAALDSNGELGLFNTTAHRTVLNEKIAEANSSYMAIAPRSNALLIENNGTLALWQIHNEHPEISWAALWEKVWYEGYQEPEFIWQSSASNNDFEPKYSLMPLAFGTLKAAFYAMLLATPLAICGAIYTAYFMAPALRRKVKPFIELMEALPTVILGFLAGLWLAPFMETNLAGIFLTLLIVPASILLFAFCWAQLPSKVRFLIPEGWDVLLLIPVVILATMLSFGIAGGAEELMFGGDMRYWVENSLGISYDQRNALVVGIAMGFAVIPTIFSITEDAIFAVPKHLSYGSLALGATPWQTLVRVVMPTASPGIFSAVMIGMGRAVGETMIVLMATGNTPIMDMNIFEGMRTLAANIAVEMPESEVGSSHYRILFLAAFVLFLFTFVVNTMAEMIRQHLRKKYGSL